MLAGWRGAAKLARSARLSGDIGIDVGLHTIVFVWTTRFYKVGCWNYWKSWELELRSVRVLPQRSYVASVILNIYDDHWTLYPHWHIKLGSSDKLTPSIGALSTLLDHFHITTQLAMADRFPSIEDFSEGEQADHSHFPIRHHINWP